MLSNQPTKEKNTGSAQLKQIRLGVEEYTDYATHFRKCNSEDFQGKVQSPPPNERKKKWEAVSKYAKLRKRKALYFWLNMRGFKKSRERAETIWGHYQKLRLDSTTEILSVGKGRV